jgi:hypothetical protein
MLNLTSAPHGVKPHLAVPAGNGAQAPQRVLNAVAVQDSGQRQRLVIGLCFA